MSKVSLPPDFLSIAEAAAVLGVSRSAVYHALDSGRLQSHEYQGKRVLLRTGLRRQYYNSTMQRADSPSLRPKAEGQDLSRMVQGLLDDRPEFLAFAEAMAELLADQLDPELWGPQPWEPWRWATVLVATDRAVAKLSGEG
jgi:excisionase family DNA binding protein